MTYLYEDLYKAFKDKKISNDTQDIICSILDRIEEETPTEQDIWQAIDDELIWTSEQWTILAEYCTPQDANWDTAINNFIDDLFDIIFTYLGVKIKEED